MECLLTGRHRPKFWGFDNHVAEMAVFTQASHASWAVNQTPNQQRSSRDDLVCGKPYEDRKPG